MLKPKEINKHGNRSSVTVSQNMESNCDIQMVPGYANVFVKLSSQTFRHTHKHTHTGALYITERLTVPAVCAGMATQ